MELMHKGDSLNEFYKLSCSEKELLLLFGYQWTNSRNISGYKIENENILIRLHNGSVYEFENAKDWAINKLSTTLRKDIIGPMIRKGFRHQFIGVLILEFENKESDLDLLFRYTPENMLEKTKSKDTYVNDMKIEVLKFYGPSDNSVVNHTFNLIALIDKTIDNLQGKIQKRFLISLGSLNVLEIINSNWAEWIEIRVKIDSDTLNSIHYIRKTFGEKIFIAFTNPIKNINRTC